MGVCVVGRVSGVCGRWGLGVCGVVGSGCVWGGGVWLVEEGEGDFFKPVNFFEMYPLNFIFEITGFFIGGQGRA